MTISTPIWMQDGTYPARLDRGFISRLLGGRERVFDGIAVEQTGAGGFTVTITAGAAAVIGDDTADQGMYFVEVTAAEVVAVPATPVSDPRTDSVILRVRDGQAGGGDAPTDADAVLEVITGTTVPDSAVLLATIARTTGESAILTAAITDQRPLGVWPIGTGTTAPPASNVEGDIYFELEP